MVVGIWAGQHLPIPPKEVLNFQGSVGPSFLHLQGRAITVGHCRLKSGGHVTSVTALL